MLIQRTLDDNSTSLIIICDKCKRERVAVFSTRDNRTKDPLDLCNMLSRDGWETNSNGDVGPKCALRVGIRRKGLRVVA